MNFHTMQTTEYLGRRVRAWAVLGRSELEHQKSRTNRIGAQSHVHENARDTRVRDKFAGNEKGVGLHVPGVQETAEDRVNVRVRAVPEVSA